MRRLVVIALLIAAAAGPLAGRAQPVKPPPKGLPPQDAEIWPFPPPDPQAWWDEKRPLAPEAANPLGGRRQGSGERPIPVDNGVDPSTYRLWGLMPLQWQLLRGSELILEVWVRPARSVRQSVVRITVRRDGKAFVQARAGFACCEAGIARRVGFDAELPDGQATAFLSLRTDPLWTAPRDVRVSEGPDISDSVCVDGAAYDLTLMIPGRARSLRRACDDAEIGQAAEALEPALRAAMGHDRRFDVIFPAGGDFAKARAAYRDLVAHGGQLKPAPQARPQPPAVEPAPDEADPMPPPRPQAPSP
ncbi:hypothetical protein [Phenylobacterium sp.]|uniref:hypothetical protein n=1 Tax=Phenylobacterium sp. TaxID=1871053 RepID=UPI002E2ED91C|nr:hypothetical protein [Phenylobacterium sp.]HEX3363471.1 hypothetical protein [Phenylobacterium sp.]